MASTAEEQLAIYLIDAHAIELQALEQVRRARKVAGDPEIAAAFADHVKDTARHERFVRDRLQSLSWGPVPQKDITARLTGVLMALFARFQPDTPGKLVVHAYAYERMELAAYELIGRLAARVGDRDTALTARMIEKDERAMAERLAGSFDRAVEASLRDLGVEDIGDQLNKYLTDAHAIERQAAKLLEKAPSLAQSDDLAAAFEDHLSETRRHAELIEERLRARGESPSAIKDIALRLGAMNLGALLGAQADSPVKLTAFAYAFEHFEVAAYELLGRVAARVEDDETSAAASSILFEERAAAARLHDLFDEALQASLATAVTSEA